MPTIIFVLVAALGVQTFTGDVAVETTATAGAEIEGKLDVGGGFTVEPVPIPTPKPGCDQFQHCCHPCNSCCPKVTGHFGGTASGSGTARATATAKVNVSIPPWALNIGGGTSINQPKKDWGTGFGLTYKRFQVKYQYQGGDLMTEEDDEHRIDGWYDVLKW